MRKINIRPLRDYVLSEYPKDSGLYQVFLGENDELTVEELYIKAPLWLKLSRLVDER